MTLENSNTRASDFPEICEAAEVAPSHRTLPPDSRQNPRPLLATPLLEPFKEGPTSKVALRGSLLLLWLETEGLVFLLLLPQVPVPSAHHIPPLQRWKYRIRPGCKEQGEKTL